MGIMTSAWGSLLSAIAAAQTLHLGARPSNYTATQTAHVSGAVERKKEERLDSLAWEGIQMQGESTLCGMPSRLRCFWRVQQPCANPSLAITTHHAASVGPHSAILHALRGLQTQHARRLLGVVPWERL